MPSSWRPSRAVLLAGECLDHDWFCLSLRRTFGSVERGSIRDKIQGGHCRDHSSEIDRAIKVDERIAVCSTKQHIALRS